MRDTDKSEEKKFVHRRERERVDEGMIEKVWRWQHEERKREERVREMFRVI